MVFSVPTWRFTSALLRPRRPVGAVIGLGIALGIGLGGCSLLLDFDTPLEAAIDGGPTLDATIAVDAASSPDAAPALVCNLSDLELEAGKNGNNDTRGDATPLNGGAVEAILSILCTETDATPDVDFFRFLVGSNITEDITITLTPATGQDLGLRLRRADGTVLEQAEGVLINEIERLASNQSQLSGGNTYFLEVYSMSASRAKVSYTLQIVRVPNPAPM